MITSKKMLTRAEEVPVISRPGTGEVPSAGGMRAVTLLPDVVNHRCLQDSEEPVLLGVLRPFLYFSPR